MAASANEKTKSWSSLRFPREKNCCISLSCSMQDTAVLESQPVASTQLHPGGSDESIDHCIPYIRAPDGFYKEKEKGKKQNLYISFHTRAHMHARAHARTPCRNGDQFFNGRQMAINPRGTANLDVFFDQITNSMQNGPVSFKRV